ncbi:MAG: type I CRISPR-associated protein Cas7 [Arcobacteraceae bacterium]
MSNTEFNKRVYGCVVVKAINANYNADFNGLPRRLKSDGSFYATDKSFKWLVRNYIKKNHENEKVLFTKQFDDKFSVLTLKQAYEKLDKKDNTLSTLLECIDVRLFGATLADAGNNLSLHGCVQVNHATDLYGKGKVYTDEILSPFATKEGDGNNTIGAMSKATEAHYIHNFSINPKNLSSWKNVIKKEKSLLDDGQETSLKLLSQSDVAILKNSFNNAATFYDSHSKSGVENELSIYVTLNENSILTLPNFAQFITFKKGENGEKNSFDISGLIKYLTKHDEEIASIDIYYIEELTTLVFDNQNSKLRYLI